MTAYIRPEESCRRRYDGHRSVCTCGRQAQTQWLKRFHNDQQNAGRLRWWLLVLEDLFSPKLHQMKLNIKSRNAWSGFLCEVEN